LLRDVLARRTPDSGKPIKATGNAAMLITGMMLQGRGDDAQHHAASGQAVANAHSTHSPSATTLVAIPAMLALLPTLLVRERQKPTPDSGKPIKATGNAAMLVTGMMDSAAATMPNTMPALARPFFVGAVGVGVGVGRR
jgi:hypothetical protein